MTHSDSYSEILQQRPLIRFSVYTQMQVEAAERLGSDLTALLDSAIEGDVLDGLSFQPIYSSFWLWVLATYEITRTMSEYKTCFSEPLASRIQDYKRHVAILRIPFAKQQFAGRKKPIGPEGSISAIDSSTKDLAFEVGGEVVWMRKLLSEFTQLVQSVKLQDVLCDLRDAPK
jgi:hypothetical protein